MAVGCCCSCWWLMFDRVAYMYMSTHKIRDTHTHTHTMYTINIIITTNYNTNQQHDTDYKDSCQTTLAPHHTPEHTGSTHN
eukprot:m.48478 g.48478  ORF g.48478 m.48478 type:complete len:81 (-) comp20761_c0_seq1:89-331(-)